MADKKQNARNNRRRNGSDDDFNPRFRKIRKKVKLSICQEGKDKGLLSPER